MGSRTTVTIALLGLVPACGRVAFDARTDAPADPPQSCDAPGGRWTDIPGGGFESADLAGWGDYDIPNAGTVAIVQNPVVVGNSALRMTPAVTAQSGYSLARFVDVIPSTRYVLSGYLDVSELGVGQSLYLDFNDAPYEVNPGATRGEAGWQFVSGVASIPAGVTQVEVRVVHDGSLTPSQSAYADEIALTPEVAFAGPGAACM